MGVLPVGAPAPAVSRTQEEPSAPVETEEQVVHSLAEDSVEARDGLVTLPAVIARADLTRQLLRAWAKAGISFQGLTMIVVNGKFVGYAAFDTVKDSNRAAEILADLGTH